MILVNAANGQQGQMLVPRLIEAGLSVRAVTRSEGSAAALRASGVSDVIVGDIGDPALIAEAVRGIEAIYHVCPGIHPREREIGFAMIDAARAQGVRHFVFSSVLHAIVSDLVQHEIKRDVEEHLISSGLDYTILQPAIYMAPRRFKAACESGVLKTGWSLDRRQTLVDIGDIGAVAFKVLTEGAGHYSATYELAGSGPHTALEMGAIIAKVLGKEIRVEEVDADTYFEALFGGRDKSLIQHELRVARSLQTRYSSHDFLGNANVLTWLLGRAPTSFAEFIASYR